MRLPRPARKPQAESTISLINVVFLMLIFFLIAGQLAPPADPEIALAHTDRAPPLPPPDALYIDKEGELRYRGAPVTPEGYLGLLRGQVLDPGSPPPSASALSPDADTGLSATTVDGAGAGAPLPVQVAADRDLAARRLLEIVDALHAAGASTVSLVTTSAAGAP